MLFNFLVLVPGDRTFPSDDVVNNQPFILTVFLCIGCVEFALLMQFTFDLDISSANELISKAYDTKLFGKYADNAMYWIIYVEQITHKLSVSC